MIDIKAIDIQEGLFNLENFLSEEECKSYINLSEELGYDEVFLDTNKGMVELYSVRKSHRSNYVDLQLAEVFWHRLEPYFIRMIANSENAITVNHKFRFYKYEKGHRFLPHKDRSVYLSEKESHYTLIMYLNNQFEGGELKIGDAVIVPKVGMLTCVKHEYLQESLEIKAGTKYVLRSDVMYAKLK